MLEGAEQGWKTTGGIWTDQVGTFSGGITQVKCNLYVFHKSLWLNFLLSSGGNFRLFWERTGADILTIDKSSIYREAKNNPLLGVMHS